MAELKDMDRALADLHTGTDRLGGLLLELELDGDRKLLDDVKLKGTTASRWSAVAGDLLAAWESHAQVTAAGVIGGGSCADGQPLVDLPSGAPRTRRRRTTRE